MARIDVVNGGADGNCALHQLRLAVPGSDLLVTGVKRDIGLADRVDISAGDQVTMLDILIDTNRLALMRLLVAGSIRSARVIDVLGRLISIHGAPAFLRSGSGPEFVSHTVLKWLTDNRIDTAIIDPGKPWENGTNESFNGKFRDECLSVEWFRNRTEARIIIEAWRRHYNAVRPHMSLDYLTPHEFKSLSCSTPLEDHLDCFKDYVNIKPY